MTSWLHAERLEAALCAVRDTGARTVLDLGCGDGDLLLRLVSDPQIERVVGLDLCRTSLERLRTRLAASDGAQTAKADLVHGSMTDPSPMLSGFDCAVLIETIEHVDPAQLSALERAVFGVMHPATVIITTPNAEFNSLLGVPAQRFRHPDHRFEWGRAKFGQWTLGVAGRTGYGVTHRDVGGCHPDLGGASQMAIFTRSGAAAQGPCKVNGPIAGPIASPPKRADARLERGGAG